MPVNPQMHICFPSDRKVACRDGFGKGILELGEKDPGVWVLTADVAESTRVHWFADKFPKRFVQIGVAEQNLAGVGAGIAVCEKTVFISAFGAFSPGRNWDQIRVSICYNNANVKVHGSHPGLTVGPDGATHQILEDIAITRVLPNMRVVVPADAEEARKATLAIGASYGPAYIRTMREKLPVFTTEKTPFELGKANLLREGKDVLIIACGAQVYESLVAAEQLGSSGISAAVINLHTIKPIDSKTIVEWAKKTRLVVTVEDHQVDGGMGSAVSEVLSSEFPVTVVRHGVHGCFCESGDSSELMKKYELDATGIKKIVETAVKNKK